MNIYRQSLEEIEMSGQDKENFDLLPGVPGLLTIHETAFILSVSPQTVTRMIEKGDITPTGEGDILKTDLIDYMLCHTLADVPVLE